MDELLDNEKQAEYATALTRARVKEVSGLSIAVLLLVLYYFGLANLAMVITIIVANILLSLRYLSDMKYIYYHEWKDDTLHLFLFNMKGERAKASFRKEDLEQVKFSGKYTMRVTHIGNKQLKIIGNYSRERLIPSITPMLSSLKKD